MRGKDFILAFASIGYLILGLAIGRSLHYLGFDDKKDLPRTQECTLQWVKPEASK